MVSLLYRQFTYAYKKHQLTLFLMTYHQVYELQINLQYNININKNILVYVQYNNQYENLNNHIVCTQKRYIYTMQLVYTKF